MAARATDLVTRRLHSQRLVQGGGHTPAEMVAWFGAMQAQDFTGAKWAVGQRLSGGTDADVERAFAAGEILRTHVLRPTWHFVVPHDIRWMLSLTAPRILALMAPYDRKLELDRALFGRAHAVLEHALRDGASLTRAELGVVLARQSIVASGQRLAHLMMRAELDQVICSGPRRGKQFTYALLDARAPRAIRLEPEAGLAALTINYFRSHGPATLRDFAWWSGLALCDATRGVQMVGAALEKVSGDAAVRWFVPPPALRSAPPLVRLLPNYDEYGIAYKDRDVLRHALASAATLGHADEFAHQLLIDGRWMGSWKRTIGTRAASIDVRLKAPLTVTHRQLLAAEVERYGRFLDVPVTVSVA